MSMRDTACACMADLDRKDAAYQVRIYANGILEQPQDVLDSGFSCLVTKDAFGQTVMWEWAQITAITLVLV